MNILNRLERRFGRYAIPNVMRIFTLLYAIGLVIWLLNPTFYVLYLSLNPAAVLHGQIWRLVTWLMFPPGGGGSSLEVLVFGLVTLFFYNWIGALLEQSWGCFRFNFYLFLGVFFHIVAAFVANLVFRNFVLITPDALNLSLFLAFALSFPDMRVYLMGFLPIRAIYVALVYVVMEFYYFVMGTAGNRITILLSLMNLGLYLHWSGALKELLRGAGAGQNSGAGERRVRILSVDAARRKKEAAPEKKARHCCTVCGRTELTNPELEFRYCSKCKGDHEYCSDHLYTHEHLES